MIDSDAADTILLTNPSEIKEFFSSYSSSIILIVVVTILIFLSLTFTIKKSNTFFQKRSILVLFSLLILGGGCAWAYMGYNFLVYHNGNNITQYTGATRVTYMFMTAQSRFDSINNFVELCDHIEASQSNKNTRPNHLIFIIGESHSVSRSQIYGYKKENMPLLTETLNNSDSLNGYMFLFKDVVAPYDCTYKVIGSLFSLHNQLKGNSESALFPMCFKNAGWTVNLFDNQYSKWSPKTILEYSPLVNKMFDYRHQAFHMTDGPIIEDWQKYPIEEKSTLDIIHLKGQHFTYEDRYPDKFNIHTPNEYENESFPDICAYYDNATLYTDYNINQVIKKCKKENAIIVYVSDHGEEIGEIDHLRGHTYGSCRKGEDMKYLLHVPMFIWISPSMAKLNPQLLQIANLTDLSLQQKDLAHTLLSLAGIESPSYDSKRDFLSPDFIPQKRIVYDNRDYDAELSTYH